MSYHFFAYMARMRLIRRWGLMRNTSEENDQEHSLQVAMIAHAMAEIHNVRYGGNVDIGEVLTLAIYHEAAEVITGDLASPIKYFNPSITAAFKTIERLASQQLLTFLPEDLKPSFSQILFPDEDSYALKIVKAADKISAYIKCIEEKLANNVEFEKAEAKLRQTVYAIELPEARDFLNQFVPSFHLSLDALNG